MLLITHFFSRELWAVLLMAGCLLLWSCNGLDPKVATRGAEQQLCPLGDAVTTDGYRRLALIIGVGDYKNKKVSDLPGAPADARRFYDLLTGKNGYGFPKQNVCLLLNEQATTARFRERFNQVLVERASESDVAVFYYAGHGSQTKDRNQDEPDENDETFLFHDARTGGVRDLVDDELNQMLARLYAKTKHVTVVLDSCNSGSATRGDAGTTIARFVQPFEELDEEPEALEGKGDGGEGWIPEVLPGIVAFTAAVDGTSALEKAGRGIFTDALIKVLSKVSSEPLTYAQVARQAPPLVAANSYQVPLFQGDLNKVVFGNKSRMRPLAWEVRSIGRQIELTGPPLPGIGVGAEFRVYDGALTGSDTSNPSKAKATIVLDEITGLNAKAHVVAAKPGAEKLVEGDLAVLVRPADETLKIKVRFRPSSEAGGISADRTKQIKAAVKKNDEARMFVEYTNDNGEFELSLAHDGQVMLKGPENGIRNTYANDEVIPENLWQHARQQALLRLQGEGGGEFTDHETLQVQLVPTNKQSNCADGVWEQAEANSDQIVPLCHAYQVKVTLSGGSPLPLLVGGIIVSSDGSIYGFPADGRRVRLNPGETTIFNSTHETFMGALPLGVWDHAIVFGTQETNPVRWDLLTQTAKSRAGELVKGGLYRALDRYLQEPGSRGAARQDDEVEDTSWTLSSVKMRVEANSRFVRADVRDQSIQSREYTIKNFDIRPYLPDDETTALYKVLQRADWLAGASAKDGFGYKQHSWAKPTDKENLALGIDCSRAIWFSFTRAGLKYNRDNRYMHTAIMVGDDSLMADEFERCDDQLRLGDILVYRDEKKGGGHVVMVIDPEKRIAWGSHGWDGPVPNLPVEPDTGVEYQLIKYKKDWQRWDRSTMFRQACWRYGAFIKEAKTQRGLPGVKALSNVCRASKQCGVTFNPSS